MAITYTWEVTGMKVTMVANTSNVVVQTYWKKTGKDENGVEGVFSGATPIPTNNINTNTFIPLNNLSQEDVLSWITPIVDNSHVNEQIKKQIDAKNNVVKDVVLPWESNSANT
mgnify:CR=1 FL=1|jgi:hypothetical protein